MPRPARITLPALLILGWLWLQPLPSQAFNFARPAIAETGSAASTRSMEVRPDARQSRSSISLPPASPDVERDSARGLHLQAVREGFNLARLQAFIRLVQNEGEKDRVTGVYAPGAFAAAVGQQPAGSPVFVTSSPREVTQFRRAGSAGSIGLLAHNYLMGQYFFRLAAEAPVYVVRGDGSYQEYEIFAIEDYRAVTLTRYQSLASQEFLDQYALFQRIYAGNGDRLVLQTCLAQDGNLSWGRRFILARLVAP